MTLCNSGFSVLIRSRRDAKLARASAGGSHHHHFALFLWQFSQRLLQRQLRFCIATRDVQTTSLHRGSPFHVQHRALYSAQRSSPRGTDSPLPMRAALYFHVAASQIRNGLRLPQRRRLAETNARTPPVPHRAADRGAARPRHSISFRPIRRPVPTAFSSKTRSTAQFVYCLCDAKLVLAA